MLNEKHRSAGPRRTATYGKASRAICRPRRSHSAQRRIQSWCIRHDHPEKGQEWSQATEVEAVAVKPVRRRVASGRGVWR